MAAESGLKVYISVAAVTATYGFALPASPFFRRQKGQPVAGTKAISDEQRELQQLRAKIKRLETEAEILKKATALLMSDPDRFS